MTKLHDNIQENYEQGNYQGAEASYQQMKSTQLKTMSDNVRSDYQMGYDQAIADYKNHNPFHYYPDKILQLSNSGKPQVADYVQGYNTGKDSTK